jgi:hypothetical protein
MTKERLEFVYFNHGSKAFERVKISPDDAHMVLPIERKAPVSPKKSAPQSIWGQPIQTTPLQQTTLLQPIMTLAHGMIRQPVTQPQQIYLVQTMQMLLTQLASSCQLNLHQPTPSARQPIRQTPSNLSSVHLAIKSQILAGFVSEWIETQQPPLTEKPKHWKMYFDGSLNLEGAGAGLLFISPMRSPEVRPVDPLQGVQQLSRV